MNELEKLQKQHYDNYVNAVKEIVNNNADSLIDIDINSLITKPPLDSMDQIKTKFISIAKNEDIILNTELLNKILDTYRNNLEKEISLLKEVRIKYIIDKIDGNLDENYKKVIKLNKKDFKELEKIEKNHIKDALSNCIEKYLLNKMDKLFDKKMDCYDSIVQDISKFLSQKGTYQKQLLESIDFKILVKDSTLMNGVKEQGERYLFTMNNSRLFN